MKLDARVLIGLILIVGGILAVAVGSFSYTEETHSADLGPVELSVEEKETVNIPLWVGLGAIGVGVVVLAIRPKH